MSALKTDLYSSRKSAFAEGSTQNLKIQWESYILFCLYFGLQYLPSNTETFKFLSEFKTWAHKYEKYSTITICYSESEIPLKKLKPLLQQESLVLFLTLLMATCTSTKLWSKGDNSN